MKLKIACLAAALVAGSGLAATAGPAHIPVVKAGQPSAAETVRYYRRYWHSRFHRGPFWVQDFWGRWRYVGPYTNRSTTHQF